MNFQNSRVNILAYFQIQTIFDAIALKHDTKANQARVALWDRCGVLRAKRTVNKLYEMH